MFLTGRGTLASWPHQEETRDKGVPVVAAGSGPLAGKLAPEYPEWSGCQSQRRKVPARVTIYCRKADPFQVMVERSDRMWSTGEGNGKPLQYSCLENPMNSMKRQNDRILKEELPRSVGAQYAPGDQWRNNSRKNEEMEPKQKQYPAVDVTGDRSKV